MQVFVQKSNVTSSVDLIFTSLMLTYLIPSMIL